jgi:redox-regulated HSP33 family molecular chaperone
VEKFKTTGQVVHGQLFETSPEQLRALADILEESSKVATTGIHTMLPVVLNGRTVFLVYPPQEKNNYVAATSFSSDEVRNDTAH